MNDQPNKPAQPPMIGGDINQVIKNDTDVATASTQPTTTSTAKSLPPPATVPPPPSSTNTTIYQQPPQKPRIIERPPINPYLKISIIRTTNDSVSCIDPNRPGKIKMIFMDQLKADSIDKGKIGEGGEESGSHPQVQQSSPRKENMIDGLARLHSSSTQPSADPTPNTSSSKNKKEIPVPTIKTSLTYNKEIPPTYNIPTSYVRHISPSYDEINEDVEYNLNLVDEKWLFENLDFGPHAKVKIIMPNDNNGNGVKNEKGNGGMNEG